MNRKERRAAQKRGGPAVTPMAATLSSAFRAHQAGHRADAERLYREVLAAEPRNAPALHLLGALVHQTGRTAEAIKLIHQAIAIEPGNPDYHYNLGAILNAAGRMEEAIEPLSQAVALKPGYAEAHFELGNVLGREGQLADAEKHLRRALELRPDNAGVMNNLGRVLRAMDRPDDAVSLWQRAATLQPNLAIAHLNIGMARYDQDRLAEAEESLRRALALNPDFAEAVQTLAFVLIRQGRAHEALPFVTRALANGETASMKVMFVRCIMAANEFRPDAALRNLVRRALEEAWVNPAELMPLCTAILKAHPIIGPAVRRVSEQWGKVPAAQLLPTDAEVEAAAQEPFLRSYLEASANIDIDFECFLTALRAARLGPMRPGDSVSDRVLDLYAALARQCFVNGYVFHETEEERGRVQPLLTAIGNAIRNNEPIPPIQLVALATYRPLHMIEGAVSLPKRTWRESVAALLVQQVEEPLQETALRERLPVLTAIEDAMPAGVQQDDGVNSHRRWTKVPSTLEPQSIEAFVRDRLPDAQIPPLNAKPAPDVLIAGRGIGLRAIEAALSYRDGRVLALDESATSLAHALRQAQALDIGNIEFLRADFMKLASTGRSFDVIEATDALHHLADPAAGWSALIAALREGGVMRVGLFSANASDYVAAARDFARQGNYQTDAEGIRAFRHNLMRLPPDSPAARATLIAEFFSTGACRHVFFPLHAAGQRLTLTDIQALAAASKLDILGLEATEIMRRSFAERYPDGRSRGDLEAWHRLERDNPNIIPASHWLWLRKPRLDRA